MTEENELLGDALANLVLEVRETLDDWHSMGVQGLPRSRPLPELSELGPLPKPAPASRRHTASPPPAPKPRVRAAKQPAQPTGPTPPSTDAPSPKAKAPVIRPKPQVDISASAWGAYVSDKTAPTAETSDRASESPLVIASSGLLIVSDATSAQGPVFEGAAEVMIHNMLRHVLRLDPAEVTITGVSTSAARSQTHASFAELATYRELLWTRLQAAPPKLIIALGLTAAQALLHREGHMNTLRGQWGTFFNVPVLATFHPEHLLKNAADKRLAFQDLKQIRAQMDQINSA